MLNPHSLSPVPGVDRRACCRSCRALSADRRQRPDEKGKENLNPSPTDQAGERKIIQHMRPRLLFPFHRPSAATVRSRAVRRNRGLAERLMNATAVYFCIPRLSSVLKLEGLDRRTPPWCSAGCRRQRGERPVFLPNADSSQILAAPAAEESRRARAEGTEEGGPRLHWLWPTWPFGDGGYGRVIVSPSGGAPAGAIWV
jgi:hypothetical protein